MTQSQDGSVLKLKLLLLQAPGEKKINARIIITANSLDVAAKLLRICFEIKRFNGEFKHRPKIYLVRSVTAMSNSCPDREALTRP